MSATSPTTLPALLNAAAAERPEREVLVFPTERLTYAELTARVKVAAKALIALGVQRGDHVGVLMHNCSDSVALLFAITSIGATSVPFNTRNRAAEVAHVVTDAGIHLVFTSTLASEAADLPSRLAEGLALAPADYPVRVIVLDSDREGGVASAPEVADLASSISDEEYEARYAEIDGELPAIMLYTSGTTSMPKGCPMLNRQLVSISGQLGEAWGTRDADRAWDALPLFHASSILPLLAMIAVRGTFISQSHFEAAGTIEILKQEKATMAWPAFGTIWMEIVAHPTFTPDVIAGVRAAMTVAPPETIHKMEALGPGVALMSCYGITEGLGVPIMVRYDDDEFTRTETAGLPFDGIAAEVRDAETGVRQPAGERGVLWLKGENVFSGYWNDPEKTAESFDADGWFNTGDLSSQDAKGYFYYHGRFKDMLKVGGENVAAVEIEAYLSTHPSVKLAQVVGVPDEKYGEVPVAFIELIEGTNATTDEILEYCQGSIASFKIPRHVRFVTEWPMSATKVRKGELQDAIVLELGLA
jgi:fatty-acyl-CoA synthase